MISRFRQFLELITGASCGLAGSKSNRPPHRAQGSISQHLTDAEPADDAAVAIDVSGGGLKNPGFVGAIMKRKILVILSNRLNPSQKARFLELDCDDKGNILKECPLRRPPRKPRYDEVWENDEGRTSMSSCHRFKRKYRHPLEKRRR